MSALRAWLLLVLLTLPPDMRAQAARAPRGMAGRPFVDGLASWYGWWHDGRLMANGARFHALGVTAASCLLPLGTRVRVTHIANGRSVELTITDRGPFVAGRIIDLSLGAAKQLRMVDQGVALVRIELISETVK